MKPIPKAERLAFNAAITEILARFTPDPNPSLPGTVRAMTDCGLLIITPDPLEHGDKVATVFLRFRDPNDATTAQGAARISGKWNIHEFMPELALRELRRRLERVNARALNEAEAQEWAAMDAERAAYWERMRKEFAP